jgi:GTP-binding protein EngB required for normal cell division
MGLSPTIRDGQSAEVADEGKAKAFSRNVLSIEISGPDRLPLTVVDLPGLIHTETAVQTTEDKDLIQSLVEKYLKEERTMVLAVVSATGDLASNEIFSKAKQYDPSRKRTLGIITKMDRLPAGSKAEKVWLKNAQHDQIELQLGWYLVKNRSDEEHDVSFAERNKSEAEFFDQEACKVIPKSNKGIAALRSRIADLVYEAGKQRLPKIRDDAQKKLAEVNADLRRLGEERSTVVEQRRKLMRIGVEFHNIVANAVSGHYEHAFFRTAANNVAIEPESSSFEPLRSSCRKTSLDKC